MKKRVFTIFTSNLPQVCIKFAPIIKGFQIFFKFFSKTFHSKFAPIIKSLNKVFKLSLLIKSIKGFWQIENLPLAFLFKNIDFLRIQKFKTVPGYKTLLPAKSRGSVFLSIVNNNSKTI